MPADVEEYLIHRGDGLIILFTPPFDKGALDPGYIKGYVLGVRENGGQYTHAAIWTVIAYVILGDGDRAGELFALLNPINHALTRAGLHKYKVEPDVAAGDVYAVWPHTGRGGWSWYTGALRAGCTAPPSNTFSASGYAATGCKSSHACLVAGVNSRSITGEIRRVTISRLKTLWV